VTAMFERAPDPVSVCRESRWGSPSKKIRGKLETWSRERSRTQRIAMVLFSRAFIRKRMISSAATASIAATSRAVAEDPSRTNQPHGEMPIQYVADRPDYSAEQPFLSENVAAMKGMMADMTIKPTGDVDRDLTRSRTRTRLSGAAISAA
jgi:hypothetical protein